MNAGNDLISRAYESEADYDLMRRLLLESLARSGPPVYATIGNRLAASMKRPASLCWILTTPGSYRPKEFHDLRTGPLALATDSHRT